MTKASRITAWAMVNSGCWGCCHGN